MYSSSIKLVWIELIEFRKWIIFSSRTQRSHSVERERERSQMGNGVLHEHRALIKCDSALIQCACQMHHFELLSKSTVDRIFVSPLRSRLSCRWVDELISPHISQPSQSELDSKSDDSPSIVRHNFCNGIFFISSTYEPHTFLSIIITFVVIFRFVRNMCMVQLPTSLIKSGPIVWQHARYGSNMNALCYKYPFRQSVLYYISVNTAYLWRRKKKNASIRLNGPCNVAKESVERSFCIPPIRRV